MFRRPRQEVPVSRLAFAAQGVALLATLPSCVIIGLPLATAAIVMGRTAQRQLHPADVSGARMAWLAVFGGWCLWVVVPAAYAAIGLLLFSSSLTSARGLWLGAFILGWVVGVSVGTGYFVAFLLTAFVAQREHALVRSPR
jgi:hypothetical protein